MKVRTLVILQNAWSVLYTEDWPYESWLRALDRSRTGQRLKVVFDRIDRPDVRFTNTTRKVADDPSGRLPPDPAHVVAELKRHQPSLVVPCGVQALEVVLSLWDGPIVAIPHPVQRVLTNALLRRSRALIEAGEPVRVRLRQLKGSVEETTL